MSEPIRNTEDRPEPQQSRPTGGESPHSPSPTRRGLIAGSAAIGAAAMLGATGGRGAHPTAAQSKLIDTALAAATTSGSLSDIKHFVILMQENRSFDPYFGTLSGVRGFSDPNVPTQTVGGSTYPIFDQFGYEPGVGVTSSGYIQPFRLVTDPPLEEGQTTNDIDHSWGGQHNSWNNGANDSFITSHLSTDGDTNGPVTMGYYTQADLPFYYALADAFTVCDGYHCSVLGPTDPNRLMLMSGSIDPEGVAGGPVVQTFSDPLSAYNTLSWKTMPEVLQAAGVSWKVYSDPVSLVALNPLPFFKAYNDPLSITGIELIANGLTPQYPAGFASDVADNKLPSVSWIIPPVAECEHPAAPPAFGEYFVQEVLGTLVSNPEVWAQTAVILVYDENGGFFDHVVPPTAPEGTAGEWLSTLPSAANGISGPIGLGFRTPAMVISPYTAGGFVYSGTLDHTSVLKLIETAFGVEAPNISAWRRSTVGDFTGAFNFTQPPTTAFPSLPTATIGTDTAAVVEAVLQALAGTEDVGIPYPLPTENSMPSQATTPARPQVP